MNPRLAALSEIGKRASLPCKTSDQSHSNRFGSSVFNLSVMQKSLPKDVFSNVCNAMEGIEPIRPENADIIAVALKEWAISHGATHYSHWFQPLNGLYAEKHDAFLDWDFSDKVIEKFSGKQLVQGEPDASSFPSGGLRSTYEARGYTGWDPTSPPFIWKGGDGITLCIPSVFFSWTGDVLDTKIPLLRSDQKINTAFTRLLKFFDIPAKRVFSTLGLEQEYFVIDRSFRNLRPDLVLGGRTVFGAPSPKGQELQDHYFGAVKDRILSFMSAFEDEAIKLAIPVKTRHNEVAPAQHEVAPVFERSSRAVDHNILLMELMRKIAGERQLSCLLHEKPFAGINGSGKHMNWSLSSDTGLNLLDPTETPGNNLPFLMLLTAILQGVARHADLLRAAIGSASNDFRLGGHEAPPAIISVYLGRELEEVLEEIEKSGLRAAKTEKGKYNLGLLAFPDLHKDSTDRNRTSPFAFTGNKFEFRAVGSSASPAFAATVLNLIVVESIEELMEEVEANFKKTKNIVEATLPVIQKSLIKSKPIRFAGDNYSQEWLKEAKKRGLPNIEKSIFAFESLKKPKAKELFKDILTPLELESRSEIMIETYVQTLNIEVNLMLDLFNTQIFPACMKAQKDLAKSIALYLEAGGKKANSKVQIARLDKLSSLINEAVEKADELADLQKDSHKMTGYKQGVFFAEKVQEKGFELREKVDTLEQVVTDNLWPLPKYRELLFII